MDNTLHQDSVIDVSDFVEVIYSYRCKLCSIVYSTSELVTGHIIASHLKKMPSQLSHMQMTTSIISCTENASVTSVSSQNLITTAIATTELEQNRDDNVLGTVAPHLVDSIRSHFVGEKVNVRSDLKKYNTGSQNTDVGAGELRLSEDLSDLCSSSAPADDPQSEGCMREMRFSIKGVEVRLAIPNNIPMDANSGSSTTTSQWLDTSASATESIQTDAVNRSSDGFEQRPKSIEATRMTRQDEPAVTSRQNRESDLQELFMCAKCSMGFMTLDDCKLHMTQQHAELFLVLEETSEVVMPPNTVSVGTQAQMYKKPGRKRKVVVTVPDEEWRPSDEMTAMIPKEEPEENSAAAINAVSMLGIGRKDAKIGEASKRRVRPPKALIEDYLISRRKHKKRRLPSESFNVVCEIKGCMAGFIKQESLEYHMECHVDVNSLEFSCPECKNNFLAWRSLRMHLWKVHSIDMDLFKCSAAVGSGMCSYRTDSVRKLDLHQDIHNEARPYSCGSCGKGFKQPNQLKNHELTHHENTERLSFSKDNKDCHICKRSFANSKSLKKHVEIVHEKKKPYLCNTCGHETSRKAMLNLHLRTHTGEKPYRCDMCNYMASDHNTLRRHRMRHTGEKPYKCLYCAYSCIQAISLKTHLKNKHPGCEGIYSCDTCQYHTVSKQHWVNHLEDHKNNLIDEMSPEVRKCRNQIHVVISQELPDGRTISDFTGNQTDDNNIGNVTSLNLVESSLNKSINQQSYTVVEFAPESCMEEELGGNVSTLEGNLSDDYDGRRNLNNEGELSQQFLQLTTSSEGYYVIMNDGNPMLVAPVQQMEEHLYQEAVNGGVDGLLVTPGTTNTSETSDMMSLSNESAVVYTTMAGQPVDAGGGLHHILNAISTQQNQNTSTQVEVKSVNIRI